MSVLMALDQATDSTGGENITRRMIQRLNRQGFGFCGLIIFHTVIGDAAAHLYQAVKAAPKLPRAGPAIGIQRHVNQTGIQRTAGLCPQAKAFKRIGTIAMHQNIRRCQKCAKRFAVLIIAKVQSGATFAQRHVR